MKYVVNDQCIGCGICAATCPDVFKMTDAGLAVAIDDEVDEKDLHPAAQAMDSCPVQAIEEE